MMNEPVSLIMTKDVVFVHPDDKLSLARHYFKTKRIQHIPVVDKDHKLVGIISGTDMVKHDSNFDQYDGIDCSVIMTPKVAFLNPDDKIGSAAELLLQHMFHAVPICDEDHTLKGIVTAFDLLNYQFNKEYPFRII